MNFYILFSSESSIAACSKCRYNRRWTKGNYLIEFTALLDMPSVSRERANCFSSEEQHVVVEDAGFLMSSQSIKVDDEDVGGT